MRMTCLPLFFDHNDFFHISLHSYLKRKEHNTIHYFILLSLHIRVHSPQIRADRRDGPHGHGGRRPLLLVHPRPRARAPRPLAAVQRRRGQALRPRAHRRRVLRRGDDGTYTRIELTGRWP